MTLRFPLSLVMWLALAAGAHAAPPPNPLPAARVTTRALDNGLTVVARTDPAAPLAAVDLWVRAGSVDDGGTGAAHALEHMVFRGSEGVPSGRVDAAVEAAGGVAYARTLPDATHYWAVVPPDRTGDVMAALADAMRPPAVAREAWELERRVMLEEIARDRGNLPAETRRALAGRLYGPPHGVPVMGTPSALARLDPDAIRAFHSRHYRPDAMVLVVVGPVEAAAIFEQAARTLGRIPAGEGHAPARAVAKPNAAPVEVEADDGVTVIVGMAWPAPSEDAAVVDVLNAILRRRLRAALGARARRVEALAPWQRTPILLLTAEGSEGDRDAIRLGLRRALAAPPEAVTAAEVAAAIRERQWDWWFQHEKAATQAATLGLAATLGSAEDATEAHPRLARVTLEDVRRAAARIFGSLEGRSPMPAKETGP